MPGPERSFAEPAIQPTHTVMLFAKPEDDIPAEVPWTMAGTVPSVVST